MMNFNDLNFDNIVISQRTWEGMLDISGSETPDTVWGDVAVVVNSFLPNNVIYLRRGEIIVGVIQIGDDEVRE